MNHTGFILKIPKNLPYFLPYLSKCIHFANFNTLYIRTLKNLNFLRKSINPADNYLFYFYIILFNKNSFTSSFVANSRSLLGSLLFLYKFAIISFLVLESQEFKIQFIASKPDLYFIL